MEIAFKVPKGELQHIDIENGRFNNFIDEKITKPIIQIKHPTMKDVVLIFHERQKGEGKDVNFKIPSFNRVVYGNCIFVDYTNNECNNLSTTSFEKLKDSFRKYSMTITNEYIKG